MRKVSTVTDFEALCCRAAIINELNERRKNDMTLRSMLQALGVKEQFLEKGLERTRKLLRDHPSHFPKPLWELLLNPQLREIEFFCAVMWKCTKDTKSNQSIAEVWSTLHHGSEEPYHPSSQGQIWRFAKDIEPDKLTQGFQIAIPFHIGLDRSIRKIRSSPKVEAHKQVVVYPEEFLRFSMDKENASRDKENASRDKSAAARVVSPLGRPLFDGSGRAPLEPSTTKIQIEPANVDQALPFGKMRYLQIPAVPIGPGTTELCMVYDAASGKLTVDCKMEAEAKRNSSERDCEPQGRQALASRPVEKTPLREVRIPKNSVLSPLSDVSGWTGSHYY